MRWRPQPGPQTAFMSSDVFEVVYGGARGGGKTDAALGEFAWHAARWQAAAKGLLVRRTRVALEPTIARARRIFAADKAVWREAKSRFEWPHGAVLYFRHLDNDADADLYQGHDYSRVIVEELTQFPSPVPVDKLKATLRSAAGAPCRFRATCNPGGPGHNWVKARHIDPGPYRVITETYANPFDGSAAEIERTFIPARLSDNPALLKRDPGYVARLYLSGSAQLVRAWLEGDWSSIEGAFFDRWSDANVVTPFAVPAFWTRFRAFDWGYAAPFSVGWWAVVSDDHAAVDQSGNGRTLPRGALVRYREWYGAGQRVGQGLRLTAEEVAAGIREREGTERVELGIADPSIFARDGGPSLAERSVGALHELGSALSIFQIKNFADEFKAALAGAPIIPPAREDEAVVAVVRDSLQSTEDFVLKRLARDFKGHAFEHFVASLLRAMGYRARVTVMSGDGGVDILAHRDDLGFEPPIIKVQVKSGEGSISEPDVKQLKGNLSGGEKGLFVTLGIFSPKAKLFARTVPDMRLVDGRELVELIQEHYEKLESSSRAAVPLRRIRMEGPIGIAARDRRNASPPRHIEARRAA